jgi:nicotinamidase-related amidase
MDAPLHIDPRRTAVLCMDFQPLIVANFGGDGRETLLERTAALLEAARRGGMMVGYVKVGFRPGYPEVSANNPSFSAFRESGRFAADAPGTEIHPRVAPRDDDIVVIKHRVGAFHGTDLDMILRANGVDTLVLAGIATSGVVLSTVRHAADADYRLVVAADCCADGDAEVHRVLTEKVFPRQARVVTGEAVVAALTR